MIKRSAEKYLQKVAEYYPVVTVLGPRQSGKTTLVKAFFKDASYVNLELASQKRFAQNDPEGFLKQHSTPLIIDEVQCVPELLSTIQAFVDANPQKASYILTGSHQPLLREKVSQSLAGRTGILHLMPLSITELNAGGYKLDRDEYILNGFMPRVYNEKIPTEILYQDYYMTYVERDVNQLIHISDRNKFDLFVRLLAGRIGQLLNLQSLAGDIGVSSTTLSSWLSILEASYLIFRLPCYYKNFGKRLLKTHKLYFTDVGLATWLLGIYDVKQVQRDPLFGGLFENMVVIEALKAKLNAGKMPDLYYFRDQRGFEVDLLSVKGNKILPIEIKAGRTFDGSMAKNVQKFCSLTDDVICPTVIYSGELTPNMDGVEYRNFADTEAVIQASM